MLLDGRLVAGRESAGLSEFEIFDENACNFLSFLLHFGLRKGIGILAWKVHGMVFGSAYL